MSTPAERALAHQPDPARLPSGWQRAKRSRWATPGFAVAFGLVALAVQAARGDVGGGVGSLAIMSGYGAVLLLLGGRFEVVSLLRGDASDERAGQIQNRAMAVTAGVLVPVLVAGFLIELARGAADTSVWSGLCALAGITYGVTLAVLTRRS